MLEKINSPADLKSLSLEELKVLAEEIRQVIVKQVSEKGGHLASNLGSVELTLSLHIVFDAPFDKLIWDVGHQAYPHKLVTGRFARFQSLKQFKGLSGFPVRVESEYDAFGVGHASTSLAAAMGFSVAGRLLKKNNRVVAIIGDGSLTGGMAFEALNNAGASDENVVFILNDNAMSIAPNVGGMSTYLTKIISNPIYNKLKKEFWEFTGRFHQLGMGIRKIAQKVDEGVKHMVLPGGLFEDMGISYFGPVNGHDFKALMGILRHVKKIQEQYVKGPCLIHVLTEKGHGWDIAKKDAYKWHASAPFDMESGKKKKNGNGCPSFARVFGETLTEIAEQDERVIAITAAMPDGTGVEIMQKQFPERVFDVGISEQYAVTYAAGLACEGLKPFVAIYSTFLQRGIDQVVHDVALQNLNVVFVLSHGGLVGEDGPTHHGSMDLSYLRMIPNMVIMAPADHKELRKMVYTAYKYNKGPIALRYPKGPASGPDEKLPFRKLIVGEPRMVRKGSGLLILSAGKMLNESLAAADLLKEKGVRPTVVDARFIKPLSEKTYERLITGHKAVLTIEDNVINGGYGSGISELMSRRNLFGIPTKHIGIPDKFVPHGSNDILYTSLGMDRHGICRGALELAGCLETKSAS